MAAGVDHRGPSLLGGVAPDYAGRGIANVAPTIVRHFGARHHRDGLAADVAPPAAWANARRVVLIVVDGLGWGQFQRTALAAVARSGAAITSVLPSTTVAGLASLATGEAPATHGLLGYRMLLPRLGAVTNMVRLQPYYAHRTIVDAGVDLAEFFPHETLAGSLAKAGIKQRILMKNAYTHSPLSRMIYRGGDIHGFVGLADAAIKAKRFLEETRGEQAFLELYWDEIDTIAHQYGPGSAEHDAAVGELAHALHEHVLPAAGSDTLVLLTADHGHVHVPRENVLDLNARSYLLDDLLLPPVGEGRFAYLHVRDGQREAVRRAFTEAYPDAVDVVDGEKLIAEGHFGPPPHHPELVNRVASLVAVPRGERKFEYAATSKMAPSPLLGNHGGVDPAEMLVPFAALAAPL